MPEPALALRSCGRELPVQARHDQARDGEDDDQNQRYPHLLEAATYRNRLHSSTFRRSAGRVRPRPPTRRCRAIPDVTNPSRRRRVGIRDEPAQDRVGDARGQPQRGLAPRAATWPTASPTVARRRRSCDRRGASEPGSVMPMRAARPSSGSAILVTRSWRSSRCTSWVIDGWLTPSRAASEVSRIGPSRQTLFIAKAADALRSVRSVRNRAVRSIAWSRSSPTHSLASPSIGHSVTTYIYHAHYVAAIEAALRRPRAGGLDG